MKNTLLRTVVIFVALCIYPSIHAYDFECDGFYYDITSDSTVSVTHDHGDFYKGDISIPNQATHNGKTYQVTTIDDRAFEGKEQLTSVHISRLCLLCLSPTHTSLARRGNHLHGQRYF